MIGEAGNTDLLIIFMGLDYNLYEHRDTAAVDVGFFFKLDENFLGSSLIV